MKTSSWKAMISTSQLFSLTPKKLSFVMAVKLRELTILT